jgi:hypothetical protein
LAAISILTPSETPSSIATVSRIRVCPGVDATYSVPHQLTVPATSRLFDISICHALVVSVAQQLFVLSVRRVLVVFVALGFGS